ncbi:hypothetical protein HPB50_027912 [Hyalomma asiaticum]|nr:hypothetical protein HPB50_027912 [Hyalomma asiaticum]
MRHETRQQFQQFCFLALRRHLEHFPMTAWCHRRHHPRNNITRLSPLIIAQHRVVKTAPRASTTQPCLRLSGGNNEWSRSRHVFQCKCHHDLLWGSRKGEATAAAEAARRSTYPQTRYRISGCRTGQTTTAPKGANINIIACMSPNGVLHWRIVERSEEPETEAVFIFDNAPAHNRADQADLASSKDSIKRLPPYSPFFNPIEEVFAKFKGIVKEYLSDRSDEELATPQGVTKKEHRRSLLVNAANHAMPLVQRVDCAAFDRHNFSFVQAALREEDM